MFGEKLTQLRKAKGLSQGDLAGKLNVVRQTVSKWEKGFSVPDAGMLLRIAEVLDAPVDELLNETINFAGEKETMKYDVIIIGAGPGGIFAAYELMQHKPELKVAVFEAGHALKNRRCPIDGEKSRPVSAAKAAAL